MDLKKERESLVAQRDNALAAFHQCNGAITLIDVLLSERQQDITVDDLKNMVDAAEQSAAG